MTPNDIEILIHYHCSPEIHPRHDAPAVIESIDIFVQQGILEQRDSDRYHTTRKGQALMEALCRTPYPIEAWVDSHGNVLEF